MLSSTRGIPAILARPSAVRFEAKTSSNGAPPPPDDGQKPPARRATRQPILIFSKPSWIVRTESNVRLERRPIPDPPCEVCSGSSRVDCHACRGKGRTNSVDLAILPDGEWPKWCRTCGGSGLGWCSVCVGTGEYRDRNRYLLGIGFTKVQDGRKHRMTPEQFLGDE